MHGYTARQSSLYDFYATESFGTLICDEEYLTKIWGDATNNIPLIAGELEKYEYGFIITDYIADSYFYHANKPIDYDSIMNKSPYRLPINAIIDTDYETKFADAKTSIQNLKKMKRGEIPSDQIDTMMKAMEEIMRSYGICYTLNPDFVNAYSTQSTSNSFIANFYMQNESLGLFATGDTAHIFYRDAFDLQNNEVAMRVDFYNKLFKNSPGYQAYSNDTVDSFTPITLTFEKYPMTITDESTPKYTFEITIKSLLKTNINVGTPTTIFTSRELFNYFKKAELIPFALYFSNTDAAAELYETFDDLAYHLKSDLFTSIDSVGKMAKVFNQFFDLIIWVIFAAGVLLLVSFARQNIKRRTYDIGVMKSLGSTTKEIGFIFGVQVLLVGLLICLCSTIALYFGTGIVNGILVESVMNIVGTRSLKGANVLKFSPFVVIINITFVLTIILLTIITSVGRLHKIKPSQIIRSKE